MPKVIPPSGRVDLQVDKQCPIFQVPPPYKEHYCYTLAQIDITAWQQKLQSLPMEMWEDEKQEGNVKIVRAAHDAWGIKKIIFTFCDDFLQQIVDLPYSQDPEWSKLLDSVYSAIGIKKSQVVRSLLARMPANVEIPTHHDTGLWVKHTHRCHLAVETHPLIEFWAGPTDDNMVEYSFDPGRIVELNNQAKHAVYNKMPEGEFRTHLIFDYVELDYSLPKRILLQPNETVFQTRRSIDLERDVKTYKLEESQPRYLIIGAQKCGTTSMYEYLNQHPLMMKSKQRELHYFDWRWNDKIENNDVAKHRLYYLTGFEKELLRKHPSLHTGESTPSYLLHSDIVLPRLKSIVPWTKLIVMLRNPVDRAFSQYQMIQDPIGTPEQLKNRGQSLFLNKTFDDVINEEIEELNQANITIDSTYEEFKDKILSNRPMNHGGHSILIRGLYCFQLEPYLAQWPKEQMKILSIKDIQGSQQDVLKKMNEVFAYLQLPPIDELDIEPKNTRKYDPMTSEQREKLRQFYAPYNERLWKLLGYELNW